MIRWILATILVGLFGYGLMAYGRGQPGIVVVINSWMVCGVLMILSSFVSLVLLSIKWGPSKLPRGFEVTKKPQEEVTQRT